MTRNLATIDEPCLADMEPRPTKVDCARIIVQHDLGLVRRPPSDHPDVIREARGSNLSSLLRHAQMAERSIKWIREAFGTFPKPPDHDAESPGLEKEASPAPPGM